MPINLVGSTGIDAPGFTESGVPVVESGSNSDGQWTRWSDGTQVCRRYEEVFSVVSEARTEGAYSFHWTFFIWTYPTAFVSPPSVSQTARVNDTAGGSIRLFSFPGEASHDNTAINSRWMAGESFIELGFLSQSALGRWK